MDDRLLFHFSRAGQRLKTYVQKQMKNQDIAMSPGQAGILFLLKKTGTMKMTELGGLLEIDNSTITRLVDRLEEMELVERRMNPKDRRQYLISITEKGQDEIRKVQIIANQTNEMIKQGFTSEEVKVLLRILDSFHQKFK
jgi:DNA-binding MarR family transcriptional regulator